MEYKSSRIKWLHSLRGVACIIVLVAHIISTDSNFVGYASGCGKIGVWLFMLFSGFFLMLPYIRDDKKFQLKDFADYYIKKIVRIYPAFLITLVLGVVLGLYTFYDASIMLLFRGAWGHFWYMPVIIKFYFVAPIFIIIYIFLKRLSKKNYNAIFIGILSVLAIVFAKLYPYELYDENSIRLVWYIPVFVFGMLLVFLL